MTIPINYIFALLGLLAGSYHDIKTREIPDWINFSMIGSGLGIALISSIINSNYFLLLNSFLGLIVGYVIALFFYKTGQWGGGDAKALMGLGALIGINFGSGIPILIILVINIFIVGAVYGFVWSASLALINWRVFKASFKAFIRDPKILPVRWVILMISIFGLLYFFVAPVIFKPLTLGVTAIIFFGFYFYIFSKSVEKSSMEKYVNLEELTEGDWVVDPVYIKKSKKTSPHMYFKDEFNEKFENNLINKVLKYFGKDLKKRKEKLWANYYNKIIAKIIFKRHLSEKHILAFFIEKIRFMLDTYPKDKREVVHEVLIAKEFPQMSGGVLDNIKEFIDKSGFSYEKELICSSKDKEGLSTKQLQLLKKFNIKKVKVKNGMPFLPSFLIAFILTWLFGNWFLMVI